MKLVQQLSISEQNSHEVPASSVFPDVNMQVYNELNDQVRTDVNVLEMIQQQFMQIQELNKKRSFLLKEISHFIIK